MQQRQAAVGMAGAHPIEGGIGAVERGGERLVGNAVRTDFRFKRRIDGLIDRHGSSGVLPSADKGRNARAYLSEMAMTSLSSCNDRANANTNYSVPLDVSPFGRPATVTSSPPL